MTTPSTIDELYHKAKTQSFATVGYDGSTYVLIEETSFWQLIKSRHVADSRPDAPKWLLDEIANAKMHRI